MTICDEGKAVTIDLRRYVDEYISDGMVDDISRMCFKDLSF